MLNFTLNGMVAVVSTRFTDHEQHQLHNVAFKILINSFNFALK